MLDYKHNGGTTPEGKENELLLEFKDRSGDEFDVELAADGIDINLVDEDGYGHTIELEDADKVRFATAILTLDRHMDLRIEEFPLGERIRLGATLVDVPSNESSAEAVLERAAALLASVGLYQDNTKRKVEEAAKAKAKAEAEAEEAGIRAAMRMVNPFLNLSTYEINVLREAGIRFEANV